VVGAASATGAYLLLGFRPLVLPALAFNAGAFVLFAADKAIAKWHSGGNRMPERTLLASAALGGGGAWLAMVLLRHKTQHARFRRGVPALAVASAGVIAALAWYVPGLR
jgi:uncharacterized membrane protein YsdA (DUF1294 family)